MIENGTYHACIMEPKHGRLWYKESGGNVMHTSTHQNEVSHADLGSYMH